VWLDAVWLDGVGLTGGQEALAGYFVEDGGGGAGGVQRAGGAGDGDPDGQVAQVTPGAGQAGGFVADQEQDGPGEVGVEDVDSPCSSVPASTIGQPRARWALTQAATSRCEGARTTGRANSEPVLARTARGS
jgi:hypothetical protein